MASGFWALQKAVFTTLSGHQPLSDLMGAARVFDDVPRDAEFPYISFGPCASRDWSTGSDEGQEHTLTLNAWSRGGGRREVLHILMLVESLLDGADLVLDGHRLVNLRHEVSEASREDDGETYRGVARFRAVTEAMVAV